MSGLLTNEKINYNLFFMSKIKNNTVYLIKNTKTSEEFLALCDFQSYFYNGDYLNLVQLFTQKHTSEHGLKEFSKIDFALYNDEIDELTLLNKRYSIHESLGEFSELLKAFNENKDGFTVSADKIQSFLENISYLKTA